MPEVALKNGWTRVAFGDVARLSRERSSNPENDGFDRFVGLDHIDPGDLRIRRWGSTADENTFTTVFRPGQVLFGKRRAYQSKVALADFSGVCSGDIYVLEPRGARLLPELLPFVCKSEGFFEHAVGTSAGSLSPRTKWDSLASYEFALPPLEHQRALAGLLRGLGALSDSLTALLDAANRVLASAAASEFGVLRSQSVPMVRLASLCSRRPQSGVYKSEVYRGRGIPMVNMGELFGNDIIDGALPMERIELETRELERYALTSNDLLFGRRSVVLEGAGRCVLVGNLLEPVVFESSVLRATVDPEQADSRYVFEWIRSPYGRQQIRRIVTFTTVSGVAGSDVARLPIPLPPLAIQRRIASHLSTLRREVAAPKDRLASANLLASTIARALLGGES